MLMLPKYSNKLCQTVWRHVLLYDAISVPLYILFDGVEVKSKLYMYEKISFVCCSCAL